MSLIRILKGEEANRFVGDPVPFVTQCEGCKHMLLRNQTCTAYPEGIPNDIVAGIADHSKAYPGDNGIRFEAK